ncbi:MAG: tyrosine-type recombinase/integrase [Candidatus Limnocylindria bacterium]
MLRSLDTSDVWSPDSSARNAWSLDAEPARITFTAAIEAFLTARAAEGASPKTVIWYRMVLGRAARDLGPRRQLDALTPDEVRAWLVTLRQTLAPISVAGYVRGLKAFGNWCAAERLAEGHALRSLRRPHVPHKLIEPLSDEAPHRLIALGSVRDRAIVLLLLDTGLRVSELAGVRGCDLRPDGSVKVTGKGARERIVPVGTAARQALLRYLRAGERLEPEEPILRAERGRQPLDAKGIQSIFKRLKTRAGIPGRCSPHLLRHTFARAYLMNGGDAFSLQRMLGHSTLDMVKRYLALADTDLAARHREASPADRLLGRRSVRRLRSEWRSNEGL